MVVNLLHLAFRDSILAEEAAWNAVVLIPKGGGYYCSIVLVEVIWKAVAVILNRRFITAITHQYSLNRLRVGRGTGTATLKVNLLQQVAALREAVFHIIFLYQHKTYDALDRSRFMSILEGYGVGPRALRLF